MAEASLRVDAPVAGVTRLTIDNPSRRNALDHATLEAIASAVEETDARCLLITGGSRVFSAGYDIGGLHGEDFPERAEALIAHPFHAAIEKLGSYTYPVVAAIDGPALGGGLELALACDLRIAGLGAVFGMPAAKLGLVYSHTGVRRFIDAIGLPRTRELFLTGRRLSARRALEWGLVNEVVPRRSLEAHSVDLAAEIASLAPLSLAGNKRLIDELADHAGAVSPDLEAELLALRRECFSSDDLREGVRAFAERRQPRWRAS